VYYVGHFDKNNINGKGKFNFKDGRKYKGNWKNNIMDRKGIFIWGSNFKYNGDYKNFKREGNCVNSFRSNLYDDAGRPTNPMGMA